MELNEDFFNMKYSNKGWDKSTEQTDSLYKGNLFYFLNYSNITKYNSNLYYSLGKGNICSL